MSAPSLTRAQSWALVLAALAAWVVPGTVAWLVWPRVPAERAG